LREFSALARVEGGRAMSVGFLLRPSVIKSDLKEFTQKYF
jgi:hypothetical protein